MVVVFLIFVLVRYIYVALQRSTLFFFAAKSIRLSTYFVGFYLEAMTPFYDHIFSLIHYFT